jgi:hypothetical protein
VQTHAAEGDELWISRQVVREYLVQTTKPTFLQNPLIGIDIQNKINDLETAYKIADETSAVMHQMAQLLVTYPTAGKQVHDTNIVATMLVVGCTTLVTFNYDDFKRFATLITIEALQQ